MNIIIARTRRDDRRRRNIIVDVFLYSVKRGVHTNVVLCCVRSACEKKIKKKKKNSDENDAVNKN